jgi:hypothetical protein
MKQLVTVALIASIVLGGCGSGSDSTAEPKSDSPKSPSAAASAGGDREATASAEATYFVAKDTDKINKAAAAVQAAGAKAFNDARIKACNDVDTYRAWRRCWHTLLDPYSKGLNGLVGALKDLRRQGFPDACRGELAAAARTFHTFGARVEGLLVGIDSTERAQQVASAKHYGTTLSAISQGFAKPFQQLTQVCYSPEDLAKINASPAPSP